MKRPSSRDLLRFRMREQLLAIEEFERLEAQRGEVGDRRRLPLRYAGPVLRVLFAVAIGFNVGMFALLLNFIVFNMIVHATF